MPFADSSLVALLGAAGVGGLITQHVGKATDRRSARGVVRDHVSRAEQARWITNGDPEDFSAVLRGLTIAAMNAQVPRRLVDHYVHAAQASRAALHDARQERPDLEPYRVGLNGEISDYVEAVRDLFIDFLWHPWRQRPFLGRRLDRLDREIERIVGGTSTAGRFLRFEYWHV